MPGYVDMVRLAVCQGGAHLRLNIPDQGLVLGRDGSVLGQVTPFTAHCHRMTRPQLSLRTQRKWPKGPIRAQAFGPAAARSAARPTIGSTPIER